MTAFVILSNGTVLNIVQFLLTVSRFTTFLVPGPGYGGTNQTVSFKESTQVAFNKVEAEDRRQDERHDHRNRDSSTQNLRRSAKAEKANPQGS